MYKGLSPGAIGVTAKNVAEAIADAQLAGFAGVEVNINEIADLIDIEGAKKVRSYFANSNVVPCGFGLPVDWRGSEEAWKAGLVGLERLAHAASEIGLRRTTTWVLSYSNELEYSEHFKFCIARFSPIAEILRKSGVHLGLEFLGPKTLQNAGKYPFIATMGEMLKLGKEIGPNVGLLLDAWHWYTSQGTIADIVNLQRDQVVYVHVNDAPVGVPIAEQVDNKRELPGDTGVIDIAGFLKALHKIGYNGPIVAEPFKDLSGLETDLERLQLISATLDNILTTAGLDDALDPAGRTTI
jgi:sugar phosphate isomerase/epimerase